MMGNGAVRKSHRSNMEQCTIQTTCTLTLYTFPYVVQALTHTSQWLLWITIISSAIASIASSLLVGVFLDQRIPILGSFIGLEKSLNYGIAFGITLPPIIQSLLIGTALIIVTFFATKRAQSPIGQIGLGLIIGGGLANVIDRILDGAVTDMIQVGSFPVFNTADSCISVGIFLLFLELLGQKRST